MAINPTTARRMFIEQKEKEIDETLIRYDKPTVEVFLGGALNVSEEAMKELKESYEKQGWNVSFKKCRFFPGPFSFFSKDGDLYIILTR